MPYQSGLCSSGLYGLFRHSATRRAFRSRLRPFYRNHMSGSCRSTLHIPSALKLSFAIEHVAINDIIVQKKCRSERATCLFDRALPVSASLPSLCSSFRAASDSGASCSGPAMT